MPGVLIDLGFISNKEEARYLGSENGKKEVAKAIAESILKFKEDYFANAEAGNVTEVKEVTKTNEDVKTEQSGNKKVYKVQIATSKKKVDAVSSNFKGLKNISRSFENGYYKYYYGSAESNSECEKLLIEAKKKGYDSAYIVADNDNK